MIFSLLALFLLARASVLTRLDAPTFGWRPTDLASIAANYLHNGFDFANPQVMWGGAGPGYVEMEFPLQPFATGLLFRLFGHRDWLCLVLPFAWGFGLVWTLALLGRDLFGDVGGFVAGAIAALSPTLSYITTTGLWPDPPMVFFGTLGLRLLLLWSRKHGEHDLWLGVVSISLAILFKLTALYLGIPVAAVFWTRYGRSLFSRPRTWLAALVMLVPALLWYSHAYRLYVEFGNTFGIIGAGYLKFPNAHMLLDASLYKRALSRTALYHLTPVGFCLFAYGSYLAVKSRHLFLLAWLGAISLHTLVVWGGVQYLGHIGYLLPIIPLCSLLAGFAFQTLVDRLMSRGLAERPRAITISALAAFSVVLAFNAALSMHRFMTWDLAFEGSVWQQKKLTGLQVRKLTRPGALIIVTDDQMDSVDRKHSMTPPDVFFFGNRRGWYRSLAWLNLPELERMRAEGAEYFVVSLQSVEKFRTEQAPIYEYLQKHFRKVTDRDGLIFQLLSPEPGRADTRG